MNDMNDNNRSDEKEEQILSEMFVAAKEEKWDAAPGFEARLEARMRDEARERVFDVTRLIWKAVPAAAVVAVVAVGGLLLTGMFGSLTDYLVTSTLDPVYIEDLITFGSF